MIQTKADKHQSPATSYYCRTHNHRLHPSFLSFLPPLLQPAQCPLPQHRTIYNPPHSPSSSHISSAISPTLHIRRPSATNSHHLHPFRRRPPFSASLHRSTFIFTTTPPPLPSFPTPPIHHHIIFHHLSSPLFRYHYSLQPLCLFFPNDLHTPTTQPLVLPQLQLLLLLSPLTPIPTNSLRRTTTFPHFLLTSLSTPPCSHCHLPSHSSHHNRLASDSSSSSVAYFLYSPCKHTSFFFYLFSFFLFLFYLSKN